MLSKVIFWRNSIAIYYHKTNTCRIATGIKIKRKHFSATKLILKSSNIPNYQQLNASIIAIKKMVDNLIIEHMNQDKMITGRELKKLFKAKHQSKPKPTIQHSPYLLDHYAKFFEFKSKSRITKGSLKHFKSLWHALKDFETENNCRIKLSDINTDWLQDLEIFLSVPRKPGALTVGKLNDNSIRKRLKGFREFWKYMVQRDIATDNKHLQNYKIEGYKVDAIALTKEELMALKHYQPKSISEQKALDIFLFCCMTGMRFSDATTIQKSHVSDDFKVKKGAIKTKDHFEVYLNETAKDILIRNNYNLRLLSNQKLNKYLKQVAEKIKLFEKPVQIESRHRGVLSIQEVPKYKVISSHTARRTFTDLLAEKHTSLQKIMAMTGHKSVSVVNRYLQKKNKVTIEDVAKIDIE